MFQLLKKLWWFGCAALCLPSSVWAFALLGPIHPNEPWQTPNIGYDPLPDGSFLFPDSGDALPKGPRNIGEEYRRNVPIIYYSCDLNFRDYFGSNGVAAIDQAFSIFNDVTNVSSYSSDLSEFPFSTHRENFDAESLSITDLKSFTMHFITEQLGLAQPERYIWSIRERTHVGTPPCPIGQEYLIIQRNFDPMVSPLNQFQSTAYVNGGFYAYYIEEDCDIMTPAADAIEFPVDPLADAFTAVASGSSINMASGFFSSTGPGFFFTGLTRDDVAGLRYLLNTNNVNLESVGAGALGYVTNGSTQLLSTMDLGTLATLAPELDDASLATNFPGLVYSAPADVIFTNIGVPNIVAYFTNSPYDPAGTIPNIPVIRTNGYTTNIVQLFVHHFANVVTNTFTTNSLGRILQTKIVSNPYLPPGSATTTNETLLPPMLLNSPGGDFYIIPSNFCAVGIVRTQLTTVVSITNFVFSFTIFETNSTGSVSNTVSQISQSIVTRFTNHTFVVNPVICSTNVARQFQGIDRIQFVHIDDDLVDPLTGTYLVPFTNEYTLVAFNPTNHSWVPMRVQRVINQPDILFSAQDIAGPGEPSGGFTFSTIGRSIPWNSTFALPGLAGPGTIDSTVTNTIMVYNKVGPIYGNYAFNAYFRDLALANQYPFWIWGSFDGSTNDPVVYPNGTSIQNLQNQRIIQLAPPPPSLPSGTNGVAYNVQLTATGGHSPYTFSLAPGSPDLPGDLTLSPAGLISGVPTAYGTFDFVIQLTDSENRVVTWNYFLTINPQ